MLASRVAERYTDDPALLQTTALHDEAYWIFTSTRSEPEALDGLLAQLPNTELYVRFVELDAKPWCARAHHASPAVGCQRRGRLWELSSVRVVERNLAPPLKLWHTHRARPPGDFPLFRRRHAAPTPSPPPRGVGLRGVGKTVLLMEFDVLASEAGMGDHRRPTTT